MRDLRQYWQEVRTLERSLPEFVWLMSLADAKRGMVGGRMAQVGSSQAAQLLHANAYRMATDEEVAAHLAREDQARRQSFHAGLRRNGIAVVSVPSAAEDSKRAPTRRR
jgi:hypothetical protein